MNSYMLKPEKFGHLLLVYHFIVPLSHIQSLQNTESTISQEWDDRLS